MEQKEDCNDWEQPLLKKETDVAAEMAGQQLALKPIKPVGLSWRGVSLSIPLKGKKNKGKTKEILHQVSGTAPAGRVTAIMGPTGSGKSSLLNALAGRVSFIKGATLEGELSVNGMPVEYGVVRRLCAYVVQDDVLYSFLTVQETLTLATHFYLPSALSEQEKATYVRDVINALGLAKARNTIIGDGQVRGVSGGERKRVSVGVELISNPSLLFLDEPTSGLDSFQAQSVMSAMGSLAQSGRTVVAAIHQPRSSIFDLLDMLVLVSEGRIIYAGSRRGLILRLPGMVLPPSVLPQ
ncbi:abc transporter g family member 7 [Nannochloropsis gaditana]|uniref:Abc transporter g family member 7 n=1 Tax=Nannochloropsis gaditana TaxID=72520 RepID=W7T6T9_9STRA|nr:abc transporter g family member 7 [Nannochloropsis gaditana]